MSYTAQQNDKTNSAPTDIDWCLLYVSYQIRVRFKVSFLFKNLMNL